MEREIERLIDCYGSEVLGLCYFYTKDYGMAEDLFQEVFVKIYKKFASFEGRSSEKTWVLRIAANTCKDYLRTSWVKRMLLVEHEVKSEKSVLENEVIKRFENEVLFQEVMALPRKYREVVVLYYYHEYETKEIAQILGITDSNARSRLSRARGMLREQLVREGGMKYEG